MVLIPVDEKKKIPVVCGNPSSAFIPAVLIEDFLFYSNL